MTHRSDKSDNPMQRKNSLLHGLKTEVLLLGIILAIIFCGNYIYICIAKVIHKYCT